MELTCTTELGHHTWGTQLQAQVHEAPFGTPLLEMLITDLRIYHLLEIDLPHFYSKPRGGYCPKPQQTHHSNKRLRYDPGREYRESLKAVAESKNASTVGSDDETQDDSLTESPVPKKATHQLKQLWWKTMVNHSP